MAVYRNSSRVQVEPNQKLPMSQKTEEWEKANVDAYIGKSSFGVANEAGRKHDMKIAYDLYNGVFDEKDFKYITDPYKVSEGFPASLQNFNIIKPKIDLLEGEETKRPFSFKVVQTNEEATTRLQDKYKEILMDTVLDVVFGGDPNAPVTDEDVAKVDSVADYMKKDFSDVAEQLGYHTLNYLNEKEDMKTKFLTTYHDLLCAATQVGFVGQLNGEPVFERVNPLTFSSDTSPDSGYIEDGDWAVRRMRMTATAIYDRFFDIMSEAQLDDLLAKFNYQGTTERSAFSDSPSGIHWRSWPEGEGLESWADSTINVWHVVWRSLKKVGFLTYTDEDGEEQIEVVSEKYKAAPEDDITWDWITEIWEGYRVGDDLYLGIRPLPEQTVSLDNPNSAALPYVGTIHNNNNSAPKSLVEIMKPLQYFYIAIMYQLQLTIARDKGKIITVDVTQIPKSLGIDANKWLHYLSSTNVNFINPYETGWDTPGREGGKPAQHTQFGQTDLTMSNVIMEYIQLMQKIEDMIGELSGVSRQRQGQVQTSELVGNVQQTIIQSSHITESYFYAHNQFKKRVYNQLLNVAKNVWANSGKKKLHYFTDDMTRVFMDITDDFLLSDMDIFVTDSTRENQNIDALRQLAQPAMQNGASLLDVAEIFTSNNLSDIKTKLTKIEAAKQKREEEMLQMQQQAQAQQTEAMSQIEQSKMELEEAKLLNQEADSIRKSETAVQVALINADSKETIENSKRDIEAARLEGEFTFKGEELDQKDKEIDETHRSNVSEEAIKRVAANKKPTTSNK